LEVSVTSGKQVFFVAQKDPKNEDPKAQDIYNVGTVANILQVLKLPDGTIKVLAEGISRGRLMHLSENEALFMSEIEILEDIIHRDNECEALIRFLLNKFED
ncbi:MAG TPA: endopeptidase La, partial [Coxiellaceae bacterium]|nr:endopeptidase La [Coxiellaceae bacterium]